MQINRVYYEHNASCRKDKFLEPNAKGLKTCIDCAGIFDKDGKGIAVTDKRLDEERNV